MISKLESSPRRCKSVGEMELPQTRATLSSQQVGNLLVGAEQDFDMVEHVRPANSPTASLRFE